MMGMDNRLCMYACTDPTLTMEPNAGKNKSVWQGEGLEPYWFGH